MKYLVVLLVVFVVGWAMLRGRRREPPPRRRGRANAAPEAMVVCSHCGIHLPQGDAIVGAGGLYCSESHRIAGPRRP